MKISKKLMSISKLSLKIPLLRNQLKNLESLKKYTKQRNLDLNTKKH